MIHVTSSSDLIFFPIYHIPGKLQLYVPVIVGETLKELVRVQGTVRVTLVIQENTAWKVSLHTYQRKLTNDKSYPTFRTFFLADHKNRLKICNLFIICRTHF